MKVNKSLLLLFLFLNVFFSVAAQSFLSITDRITNEDFQYQLIDKWEDGTEITDAKTDGVIYIKNNKKFYRRIYSTALNGAWFGMISNDYKDDSAALQTAINYAFTTSQKLIIPFGRYDIKNTILLPQHFHYSMKSIAIDFSNSVLILNKDISLFRTTNWRSKIDQNITNGVIISNFDIVSTIGLIDSYAIEIQDFHQGTKFENVSSFCNKNMLHSINSYYLELSNINTNIPGKGGVRFRFEGYHGLNKLSKLSAVNSNVGYLFEKGMIAALDFRNNSIEGCSTGIHFDSEVYSLSIESCYFENFNLALLFNNYIHSATVTNNYFNFLNNKNSFLIQYKGLPANNIFFSRGNSYIDTDFSNIIKNKEDLYGEGIIFEFSKLDCNYENILKTNKGKNNIIKISSI